MDITILYYTANRIPENFAINIRRYLLKAIEGRPIISVSQKPIDFGRNFCVGEIGWSIYNVYVQVLAAARKAKTKYVACCEDDALYPPQHFNLRPPNDTFMYNINRWGIYQNVYYWKKGSIVMSMCIVSRELLIETLKARFRKYPTRPISQIGWGEPGRNETYLGLPTVKISTFGTFLPTLTFNHPWGLSGSRAGSEISSKELPYWGKATNLWKEIIG